MSESNRGVMTMQTDKIKTIQDFAEKHQLNAYKLDDFIQQIAPGLECHYFVCSECEAICHVDEMVSDDPDDPCTDCATRYEGDQYNDDRRD